MVGTLGLSLKVIGHRTDGMAIHSLLPHRQRRDHHLCLRLHRPSKVTTQEMSWSWRLFKPPLVDGSNDESWCWGDCLSLPVNLSYLPFFVDAIPHHGGYHGHGECVVGVRSGRKTVKRGKAHGPRERQQQTTAVSSSNMYEKIRSREDTHV